MTYSLGETDIFQSATKQLLEYYKSFKGETDPDLFDDAQVI